MLEELHELIKRFGRARVSLVGHSMGGAVCSYYAGSFPERIHRLTILEGLGPPEQRVQDFPARIPAWLSAWERVRGKAVGRYANVAEAAERNDPQGVTGQLGGCLQRLTHIVHPIVASHRP